MFKRRIHPLAVSVIALLFPCAGANATISPGSTTDWTPSIVYNVLDGSLTLETGFGYGGPQEIQNISLESYEGIFRPTYASSVVWYATDYTLATLPTMGLTSGTVIGNPNFLYDGEQESFLLDDLTFIFEYGGSAYYGDLVYDTGIIPPITGDQNDDGFVGIEDLNIILSNWNQSVPPGDLRADPSGDGFVGIEDLNVVLGNWNSGTPPAAHQIPEPATALLLTMILIPGLYRRA